MKKTICKYMAPVFSAFILFLLIVRSFICFSPLPVMAAGIGVAPSRIDISDALRGGGFERMVTVFNTDVDTAAYAFSAEGDIGGWVTFYENVPSGAQIDRVTIPGNENRKVTAKFDIPADAPSGTYNGFISVSSVPLEGEGASGQIVTISARVDVSITVTGTQVMSGLVQGINITDTEVSYPLRIHVHFKNTGNVTAAPLINVKIHRGELLVDNFSTNEATIKPDASQAIQVEWNTNGKEAGDYSAQVEVLLEDNVITTSESKFAILPQGTLSRVGEFIELKLDNQPRLGGLGSIAATFVNTGQIDTKAKFIGEVYRDGELTDVSESEEVLVQVGEQEILKTYLELGAPGEYHIKGYINYEGKKTSMKEITFAIASESTAEGAGPFNIFLPGAGVIGVIVVAIIYMTVRRNRSSSRGR